MRNSRQVEVTDRAAQMDDITNIDFDGYVDGVAFDGGKAEGHTLKLGSGAFIPGFEEQIVGKNIGEEFDVTEARAKVLVKANVCEIIAEPTPTTEEVVKPVTKTRKKKEA